MEYFEHALLRPSTVEKRAYQERLVRSFLEKGNTLIVAPTAIGKTVIAAIIAAHVIEKGKNVLILAPTKPLAVQHNKTFCNILNVEKNAIVLITGTTPAKKRALAYGGSKVVCATPQCIENDIKNGSLTLGRFGLCIFDEAHRAVGNYAYVFIGKEFLKFGGNVLALTASPGHEREHIVEVCRNLNIRNIEIVTENDPDVKPYLPELKLEWLRVSLPEDFVSVQTLLRNYIRESGEALIRSGLRMRKNDFFNRSRLLEVQKRVSFQIAKHGRRRPALYGIASKIAAIIKANHALLLLETQSVNALMSYFERLYEKRKVERATVSLFNDERIKKAIEITKELHNKKAKHPKLLKLFDVISEQLARNPESRVIVFNHYRDSVSELTEALNSIKEVRARAFVGQAKKLGNGMSQKEQTKTIEDFESGKYNVIVATSVAEEGLNIPSCDLVVFYEPVPSEIRQIQRRGRTARLRSGRVVILITRDTKDESAYWNARRKEKGMFEQLRQIKKDGLEQQSRITDYASLGDNGE
ncbi:MAG: helicase-related protein [Candidatus Diapherotrites archaeon]|nr:helicase-related protein [Candidatus Diapherotrites archaeon]